MSKNHFQLNKENLLALALGVGMLVCIVINGIVLTRGFISVFIETQENSSASVLDTAAVEAAIGEVIK